MIAVAQSCRMASTCSLLCTNLSLLMAIESIEAKLLATGKPSLLGRSGKISVASRWCEAVDAEGGVMHPHKFSQLSSSLEYMLCNNMMDSGLSMEY